MNRRPLILVALIVVAAVVAGGVIWIVHSRHAVTVPIVTKPAPAPSTQPRPATRPSVAAKEPPKVEKSLFDVVRAEYPSMPATQPLAVPLDLSQAARLILHDPVYLSRSTGDLWITRPDAPPTPQVLCDAIDPKAVDPQTHATRERVLFVHWMPSETGPWRPYLICRGNGDQVDCVSIADGRKSLPARRDFQWDRAFSWNEKMVVPSRTGVSVFELTPRIKETYDELTGTTAASQDTTSPNNLAEPQVLLDWQGLLAWIPWDPDKTGGRGAARYVGDKWVRLDPAANWPEKIVHLVPLRDGSVIQFFLRDDGTVAIETAALDRAPVDAQAVQKLVEQLADVDQEVRRKALSQLADFGQGAWPIMEKLLDDQPPQAQLLLKQLLQDKTRPTLGGMTLLGSRAVRLASRLSDGGAVFYAEQGVQIPEPDGDPSTLAPAWLSIRPGDYIHLLPPSLVLDLKPDKSRIDVVSDQWILDSDVRGPRLFFGNGFTTLLHKDERQFNHVIGVDRLGRWLFRSGSDADAAETLIIDPHLPDPTPRLPVWQLAIADTVGWDKNNWPVVKNGSAYALTDSSWRALGKDEPLFTTASQIPAATEPTTRSSGEVPLLELPDGSRYYGGLTDLKVVSRNGRQTLWPLPPAANGAGPPVLIRAGAGRLFLFNQPGRVLRIAPTPGKPEPFKLEATFTHDIPVVTKPIRIWLDPAGRIDIAYDNRIALLFADGYIPPAITEMMLNDSSE